jgi:TatD DNase family protein
VAASVAELMNREVDEIIQACTANSRRMFNLPGT